MEFFSRIQEKERWGSSSLWCHNYYCPFPSSLTDGQHVATMNSSGVLNLDLMSMEKNVSIEKTRASLTTNLMIFSLQYLRSNSKYKRNKEASSPRTIKRAKWKGEGAHGHYVAVFHAQNPLGLMGSYADQWHSVPWATCVYTSLTF